MTLTQVKDAQPMCGHLGRRTRGQHYWLLRRRFRGLRSSSRLLYLPLACCLKGGPLCRCFGSRRFESVELSKDDTLGKRRLWWALALVALLWAVPAWRKRRGASGQGAESTSLT